jgi:TonB family protein
MSEMTGMIGRDGRIEELKVVNATHPAFAREALAVVAMWQFSPTYLNCSPVATKFDVTVNFQRQR